MQLDFSISSKVFNSILNVDVEQICTLSATELRLVLPCLVRMSLIAPLDTTPECTENRRAVLKTLSDIDSVNGIIGLLSVDFHGLEQDLKQEHASLKKRTAQGENILQNRQTTLALEFERGDSTRRLRFVLSELLLTGMQVQEFQKIGNEFFMKSCDLFDNDVYIPEVCDVINISLAELPAVLSIHDITQILLHVKHGPEIICCIAANFPDHFNDTCVGLIVNSEKVENENGGARIRMATLTLLCRMNPQAAYFVRSKCVEMCKMAALTVSLTLEFPHCFRDTPGNPFLSRSGDIVPFVSGLLLGTDQHVRNWFTAFTKSRPKKNKENNAALQILREELVYQLKAIVKSTKDNHLPDSCVVYCTVLFRLYCALRGIAGVKFQDNEILLLMKLITVYPPATIQGIRFASVAVCMIIACPSLISVPENEAKCTQWLKWLSGADSPFFGKPTSETSTFSEMLLLLAIHIHSNQINPMIDLVCSTLGMKVSFRTHNMPRIKAIFIEEVFTEQVVASRAVKVLVTPNLNSNITGFLPIHCIHQLMKSRAFTKYKVNVKDWIYKQICASIAPMHLLLPPLIEVYVHSMLTYSFAKVPYEPVSNEPITEEEIMRVFKKSYLNNDAESARKNLMPQLLLLYYVLLYEKVRLSNNRNYVSFSKDIKSYSLEFLSEFPIKYLILQAQKEQKDYSGILPPLLRLLLAHFPHLQFVEDWLNEEDGCVAPVLPSSMSENILSSGLKSMALCPSQASRVLHYLLTIPAIEIWQYVSTFVECMPYVLDNDVPRYIQELYTRVWLRYNGLLPCALWTMTMNVLKHADTKMPFIQSSVVQPSSIDPLQILRCNERVYRCPPIVSIIIRILQSSLAASRSQLNRHLLDRPCEGEVSNNNEREELKTALIAAQESAAIQILLEVCAETGKDKDSLATFWSLSEIRSLICSYIHQAFIADPRLAQLVHFQGYQLELIPVTVTGIPSMHICAEFIPEIINQPSLEKQSFAVNLISHVSLQFAIPYTREMASLSINTLYTLLKVLTTEGRTYLFMNTLSALVRICQAFPPLAEDVFPMLIHLGKLCISDASFNTCILYDRNMQISDLTDDNCNLSGNVLFKEIVSTFEQILTTAIFNTKIYAN